MKNENNINIIEEAEFYKDFLNCILTKGFKNWCDENGSYWVFSDMARIIMDKKIRGKEDFIIMFVKSENRKAEINLYRDYEEDKSSSVNRKYLIHSQKYDYTDLKEGFYKFYICYNEINTFTFMLPEEY